MAQPLKTFIIYARNDAEFKNELLLQLHSLVKKNLIEKWDDTHLLPGEEWEKRILKELAASDLVILLVSAHSLHSEFIQKKELKTALEQKQAGITRVIPILVRDCLWEEEEELTALQMLPRLPNAGIVPVAAWPDRHSAWAAACRELIKLVTEIQAKIEALAETEAREVAEKAALEKEQNRGQRLRQQDEAAWKTTLAEAESTHDLEEKIAVFDAYLDVETYTIYIEEANLRILELRDEQHRRRIEAKKKEDARRRAEDERHRRKEETESKKREPKLIFVQGGTFQMGSNEGEKNEKPVHPVTLHDFYLGRYPVTVIQFKTFIEEIQFKTDAEQSDGSNIWQGTEWEIRQDVNWRHDANGQALSESELDHPVIHVSWNDAVAYCDWLFKKTGRPFRLPTESEWEFAARGGVRSKNYDYSGSDDLSEVGWFSKNSGLKSHAIGKQKANELGLYDMSGNVWEWCNDWYGDYPSRSQSNPIGAKTGANRVGRGGSWLDAAWACRSTCRGSTALGSSWGDLGFRLALSL